MRRYCVDSNARITQKNMFLLNFEGTKKINCKIKLPYALFNITIMYINIKSNQLKFNQFKSIG